MMQATPLLPDEHEVPTHLGERVPVLPALPPFDWTMRQLYGAAIVFYLASLRVPDLWDPRDGSFRINVGGEVALYIGIGVAWVILEYVARPRPEFWLSAWFEYLAVLMLSFPLWWRRLFPPYDQQGVPWPLATLPHWIGDHFVHDAEVLPDGVVRRTSGWRRKPVYVTGIAIQPRPNPDLLPMLERQRHIQARLSLLATLRAFCLQLVVRPFPLADLERASGPAWEWVEQQVASRMVLRRPVLVFRGETPDGLVAVREAMLKRFEKAGMPARALGVSDVLRDQYETWGGGGGRVRIGVRRTVTGRSAYRSFVVKMLPRVIHLDWLHPLTSEALLCSIALHVSMRAPGASRRSLQRRIRRWRAVDTDEDYGLAEYDARRMVAGLMRRENTETQIGMYVTAYENQATKVAEALDTAQCEFSPADWMQHRALRATRLLGDDPVRRTMQLDLRTCAATDLLATEGYWPTGATLMGRARNGVEPVGLNVFDEDGNLNWATFITIIQGGGKTTTGLTLAWRMANPHPDHPLAASGVQIVSIDFKSSRDYATLFEHLEARGHRASYNAWTSGPLPELVGHMGFNLSDVAERDRGKRLLELG